MFSILSHSFLLASHLMMALGDYELQVTIHSFDNPGRKCADCKDCCDGMCSKSLMCHYYFSLCQKPAGTPVSYVRNQNQGNCPTLVTTHQRSDGNNVTFTHSAFKTSNPITFSGESWPNDGVQLFLEIIDFDPIGDDELIDRFAINMSIPVGNTTERTMYTGIFGFATINMSFTLTCTENFYGPNCGSTNQPNVIVIATSTSIGSIVLLFALIAISVALSLHIRKRNKRKVNNVDEYEMDATVVANSDDTGEPNPNDYAKLNHPKCEISALQGDKEATAMSTSLTLTTNSMAINKEYEEIDDENSGEYDFAKNGETQKDEYDNPLSPDKAKEFKFTPAEDEDFYDYDSPYWMPSNEERELMTQFKKLRIPNISQRELKETAYIESGAFGTVHKEVWSHSGGGSNQVVEEEVAVKSIENGTSEEERVKFLQEAAIMGQFNHPNIVRIMGILIKENKCKIIMELMLKGNLRSHLPALQSSSINHLELASQLLCYSRQIASGMSYLSLKGYIHRDLAARNILVSGSDICKIGDFGLSRDLNNENYYMSHGGMIPVKWTAPEALHYRLYSTASDVWSYGCVLYEIWTLGVKPYSGLANGEVIKKISTGYRLPPPPGCPRIVYEAMIKSWNTDSSLRPGFYDICSMLNLPDYKILSWTPEDLSAYSEEARTLGAPLAEAENMFSKLQQTYS